MFLSPTSPHLAQGLRGGLLHHHRADFLRPNGEHFGEGRADGTSIAWHPLGDFWRMVSILLVFYVYFPFGKWDDDDGDDDDDDDDDDDGLSGLVFFSGGWGASKQQLES